MSLVRGLSLLIAIPALSPASSASQGKPAAPARVGIRPEVEEHGSPALFAWADFDLDRRLDLAAVGPDGRLQLLVNRGEAGFEDVTERVGLGGIANAALPLWGDYDGDLRLDLFIGAREGASRFFRNDAGSFVDMSAGSGLFVEGAVRSAHWLDEDGDGRLDLHVVTAEEHQLFRGLEGGFFEVTELPPIAPVVAEGPAGVELDFAESDRPASAPETTSDGGRAGHEPTSGPAAVGSPPTPSARTSLGPTIPPTVDSAALLAFPIACASSIQDQSNPGSCLEAATTPTLGKLYPLSANLFVAVSGEVGIGTTSPAAKLDVAGTARIADTLTLAPSGDQALNVSTGSIYKAGALFIHTKGSNSNTALGRQALSVTTGSRSTAIGAYALRSNTTGYANTASGADALRYNTTGLFNTASGAYALRSNTTASLNTASGFGTLWFNTTGFRNTANGANALRFNTTGSYNTATGHCALRANTTGFRNTAIGDYALLANTTGYLNTAAGYRALRLNTTGYRNTAMGVNALQANLTGIHNTAIGYKTLPNNTSGDFNIALGYAAGSLLGNGDGNIVIGSPGAPGDHHTIRIGDAQQHHAFIAAVRGRTTDNANAIPVLIDSAGQLGTISSSRRFKKDIRDMGDATARLLELRPVLFRYKQEQTLPNGKEVPPEYGLIAEEVAEIFPDLVVYDEEGLPFTVKYHLLSSMLLNELARLDKEHSSELDALRSALEAQRSELDAQRARLVALESRAVSASRSAAN